MSDTKKVLEGPDGMLYEIPADVLASCAVPGARVGELRARLGQAATSHAAALPPGHHRAPPAQAMTALPGHHRASPAPAMAPMVINIYVGAGPAPTVQVHHTGTEQPARTEQGVEGYHLAIDEHGIPHLHAEMLWGDYFDKQGRAAVGMHSHDPIHGNAQ